MSQGFEFLPGEGFERGIFAFEERVGFGFSGLREQHGAFAGVGHAVVQDEVGEIGETEQRGFFAAQFEDARR